MIALSSLLATSPALAQTGDARGEPPAELPGQAAEEQVAPLAAPRWSLPPGHVAVPVSPRRARGIAGDPHRPPPDDVDRRDGEPTHSEDGAGPRISFGRALTEDLADGWYGRIETDYFIQRATDGRRRVGPTTGILVGLEGWGSEDGGGGGVPTTLYLGYRMPLFGTSKSPGLFGTAGVGWDWVIWDLALSDGGFGLLAPFAKAAAGIDLGGVRLLADGEIQYRWQWDATDRRQLKIGASLAFHSELWDG